MIMMIMIRNCTCADDDDRDNVQDADYPTHCRKDLVPHASKVIVRDVEMVIMMIVIRSCPCAGDHDKDDLHDAERPLQLNTTTPAGLTMLDDANHDGHEENNN